MQIFPLLFKHDYFDTPKSLLSFNICTALFFPMSFKNETKSSIVILSMSLTNFKHWKQIKFLPRTKHFEGKYQVFLNIWTKIEPGSSKWSLHWTSVAFTQQFDIQQEPKEIAAFMLGRKMKILKLPTSRNTESMKWEWFLGGCSETSKWERDRIRKKMWRNF